MGNSRKIIPRKNYFPWFNSFLSPRSYVHKSTKTRFPENPSKVVQLQNYITSWKMVVRSWYMTHFDRRDLLKSKKKLFRIDSATYPASPARFSKFFDFFGIFAKFRRFWKSDFLNFRVRKKSSKMIFIKFPSFLWNYDT